MEQRWWQRNAFWIIIGGALLIIDQTVKAVVIKQQPNIDLRLFRVVVVKNTGASFGMLGDANALLIWVAIIAIGLFLTYHDQLPALGTRWGFVASAGVMSNVFDRVIRGGVIDYVDLGWWPVFNLGDATIVIGVAIIGYALIRKEQEPKQGR
ncbi:signal peptidase II [Candidatus Woesearchaeota archaeon]|nr:signal peptidase II [Candidatus Woesearchaeota archaeon]